MTRGRRPPLKLYLLTHVLESIDEYSRSMPTMTTPGKVWRRAVYNSRRDVIGWRVGVYGESYMGEEHGRPVELTPIYWFDVEVLEGPAPADYHSPDWSNYARWEKDRDAERVRLTA